MNDTQRAIIDARIDASWEIANALLVEVRKGCQRHGEDPMIHIIVAIAIGKLIDGLEGINPKITVALLEYLKISSNIF